MWCVSTKLSGHFLCTIATVWCCIFSEPSALHRNLYSRNIAWPNCVKFKQTWNSHCIRIMNLQEVLQHQGVLWFFSDATALQLRAGLYAFYPKLRKSWNTTVKLYYTILQSVDCTFDSCWCVFTDFLGRNFEGSTHCALVINHFPWSLRTLPNRCSLDIILRFSKRVNGSRFVE